MSFSAFNIHQPRTVDEALRYMTRFSGCCSVMAGGTDLLPGFARHLNLRQHVISLTGIGSLTHLSATSIGACVTLAQLIEKGGVLPPVIAETARGIAGPAVRSSATVGGNLLLSSRCRYFNQSALYRSARGSCMKAGGSECLVVAQDESCYAISSGDLVPVMLVLGASFRIAGPDGERLVAADDFYLQDGIQSNILEPNELLTEVILPEDVCELEAEYMKLGARPAIDFSEADVAVAIRRNPEGARQGGFAFCRVALGALGPGPLVLTIDGEELHALSPVDLTDRIWKELSPRIVAVRNGSFRPGYRKAVAKEYLTSMLTGFLKPSP